MIEIKGEYGLARLFTDTADQETISQVFELCNQAFTKDATIRIMPDCHAGKGCVIGTVMTIKDKVVPNLVGVDIGCGMLVIKLLDGFIDFKKLDKVIREFIPSGFAVRGQIFNSAIKINYNELVAPIDNLHRIHSSIGTLGGGNHFIEVDIDYEGRYYLVIHSGSRNLGKQVAEYWQQVAIKTLRENYDDAVRFVTENCKKTGDYSNIETMRKAIAKPPTDALAYLTGKNLQNYINDMQIAQQFATLNRSAIAQTILEKMDLFTDSSFETVHNYIDTTDMILRKGAVSARVGERFIVPINMRDGSLIAVGKSNPEWLMSAPHGAGRLMSRGSAKRLFSLGEFEESMEGIYTTSVGIETLDESPMAYKPMAEIVENTADTMTIEKIIKPVYNFKDSGKK